MDIEKIVAEVVHEFRADEIERKSSLKKKSDESEMTPKQFGQDLKIIESIISESKGIPKILDSFDDLSRQSKVDLAINMGAILQVAHKWHEFFHN